MARNNIGTGWTYAAVAALAVGAALAACQHTPPAIDLAAIPACPAEDGPGLTGPVPCAVDTPNVGGYGTRWVLYSPDTCPKTTVQPHEDVTCISRDDWTGGTGSGEGRTN